MRCAEQQQLASSRSRLLEERQRRGEKHLARTQNQQLLTNAAFGVVTDKLGGAKLASRKIECGKSDGISGARHAGQKVVLFRVKMRIHRRSRREHARDLALHQRLGQPRILHLLADGDLEALANQLGNVVVGGVIGHAAHGNGSALFFVARGERDLQLARGDHRIFEEKFVEVTQAEEEERIGMLFLDRGILPHQRCGGLAHRRELRGL